MSKQVIWDDAKIKDVAEVTAILLNNVPNSGAVLWQSMENLTNRFGLSLETVEQIAVETRQQWRRMNSNEQKNK